MNTKTVLDRVFTRIKDNSSTLRVKMLGWLNSVMQDVVNERAWLFLDKSVTLPITAGAIVLPADFGRETFIRSGDYLFTIGDRLAPQEAALADSYGGDPHGYTVEGATITFHPATTGTASLSYTAAFPALGYFDSTDETLFPDEFLPLFAQYLLTCFYEYDVDADRLPVGLQVNAEQLRRMKKLDNQRKPLPQLNAKGLVRE
jgi:hypothetical protein